jgi:GT2 family glycosyltransferase
MPPPLSIVIPSHQRPDLLRACLGSIQQHAPSATQIVVVDDASPGGIVTTTARTFAAVDVLRLDERRGFCVAANAGIRATHHPIVELLNDDTEVTAGWAEAALRHFGEPRVAAVAPLVLCWPGGEPGQARIDSAGDSYHLGGIAAKRGHGELLGPRHLRPCRVFGASGSSAFYRRDLLLHVGAFPEPFGAYFDDIDLSFRLHRAGGEVVYEPAARVLHHVSASYGRPSGRLLEQQSLNEERVFWRNVSAPYLPAALPLHLAIVAAKGWRRWREGTLAPFLRGRLRLLTEIPEVFRHRQFLGTLERVDRRRRYCVACATRSS